MAQPEIEERPGLAVIVAANVYRLRVLKVPKWSQGRLATEADVDIKTIQNIENARDPSKRSNYPQLDTIEKIAIGLGVDPSELLVWDPATTRP
jgi:transcriptional regulator with XRE-family HTH domain